MEGRQWTARVLKNQEYEQKTAGKSQNMQSQQSNRSAPLKWWNKRRRKLIPKLETSSTVSRQHSWYCRRECCSDTDRRLSSAVFVFSNLACGAASRACDAHVFGCVLLSYQPASLWVPRGKRFPVSSGAALSLFYQPQPVICSSPRSRVALVWNHQLGLTTSPLSRSVFSDGCLTTL